MHEETRLDGAVGLTQADGCELCDNNRSNLRVFDRNWTKDLGVGGVVAALLGQLLLLHGLLQVAGGQAFDVVDYDVNRVAHEVNLDDLLDLLKAAVVALLLLDAVAQVVAPLLKQELLRSNGFLLGCLGVAWLVHLALGGHAGL